MEGIVLTPDTYGTVLGALNAATLIILAAEAILLGSLAEEEWNGRRVFSAEWPIPEPVRDAVGEGSPRKAA